MAPSQPWLLRKKDGEKGVVAGLVAEGTLVGPASYQVTVKRARFRGPAALKLVGEIGAN
jgi:hypothetical protein